MIIFTTFQGFINEILGLYFSWLPDDILSILLSAFGIITVFFLIRVFSAIIDGAKS